MITKLLKKYKLELIIILLALMFSTWLMFSSFSYNNGSMQISSKSWSDFASHIPLIRSFSLGENFPPQYPLFSGPAIKYHFIFFAFVGILEKYGLRIDYALNIPSILGFTLLILVIFLFSKQLFKSKSVGIISIFLFLFNSSLDFINFFKNHPSINVLKSIITNTGFPSFGPYDGKTISAFWNLNIYTNQRHLALSYALSLLLILFVLRFKNEKTIKNMGIYLMLGVILGLCFYLNIAVFIMTILILGVLFLFYPNKRISLIILIIVSCSIALPQYLYYQSAGSVFAPVFYPGYLIVNFNLINFINYWWQNLGLSLITIPLGFIIAKKNEKKVFLAFFILFIVGNLFQFSPEIAANHKFFNFFIIIGNMFTAFILLKIWRINYAYKLLTILLFLVLILSGIIDLFPLVNDSKINLPDYKVNKDIAWIINNTPKNAVFLNTDYLYDDASLAGRKIYLGWPYFAWSQGYDTDKRSKQMAQMLGERNKETLCLMLNKNHINYIEINRDNLHDPNLPTVSNIFDTLVPSYNNQMHNYSIYDVKLNCHN